MPSTTSCTPCCATPQVTNIPGPEGSAGSDGSNGISAFTLTTADFVVPAVNSTVTVLVGSSLWAVIGMIVIAGQGAGAALAGPGPSTFLVTAIPGLSSLTLKYLGYSGDVAPTGGNTISAGAVITANGGSLTTPISIANGGTGQITAALAANAFGARYRMLGRIIGANMNSTADQAITGLPSKWIPRRFFAQNASADLSAATIPLGGIYTAAGKGGTAIVAATQSYVALSTAAKWVDLTLAAAVLTTTDVLTATTVYFSLSTAHGSAATADVWLFGEDLT